MCYECGNKKSDIHNNPDKIHEHNLILLRNSNKYFAKYILTYNLENTYEADFKYFNMNHFEKDLNYYKTHYQVKCDGCLTFPIKTTRWKCCNCVFRNLCDKCFCSLTIFSDKMDNIDNYKEFNEEITRNLGKLGCDATEHVFMKILFDGYFY